MAICTCSVCVAVAVYTDEFGEEQPGADIPKSELKKHQRQEKERQLRAARGEDHAATNVVLTTLVSRPSTTLPIRNRDREAASVVSSSPSGGPSVKAPSSDTLTQATGGVASADDIIEPLQRMSLEVSG
ncbi:hypothetical protein L226DRAFT_292482 [Lentinus tigrinus ALCF2SS1-7]|uniref:uncharacterized protein n=1 Tax=Lentinus tigrinus ALCF2SS1-7 TaxID=1328758 RepID=UPI001165F063|nr:hypothetical protein L226DRAFT_292482 [Lentinus tigrinus ALCF2SS1-7]